MSSKKDFMTVADVVMLSIVQLFVLIQLEELHLAYVMGFDWMDRFDHYLKYEINMKKKIEIVYT